MAFYNNHINIAKTHYDLKNKYKEIEKAIQNKEVENMSPQDFEKYLAYLTRETQYVEQSNNIIKNVSKNKWKKDTAKGSYKAVNDKINKLNQLGFYDIISKKENNSTDMMNKVLNFNSLNKEIFLSEQRGGVINESIRSFKESYDYFTGLKEEAMKTGHGRSFFAFDLETTGGKNLSGVWHPDSITEFSLQEFDIVSGERIKNHTMIVGMTKDEGDKILKEIKEAIADGSINTNERLRVSAMRYSLYGDKNTSVKKDEVTKLLKIDKFANADNYEMMNIEKIEKGVNLFVEAGDYYSKNSINGVRMDHHYMGKALKDMNAKTQKNFSALIGQNHIGHDIPIMQNQLLKWHNQYKHITDMFDMDMDIEAKKTIDLLGGTRAFIEYNGVAALYPGDGMKDAKKVAGQEYMAQIHLSKLFTGDNPLAPHKAEDDVAALAHLFVTPSEILDNNTTVLEHIHNGLNKVKTTDTLLEENTHILRAKKRAGSYGGKGYINFASDSQGTIYTASDHILGKKDSVSSLMGGAYHENFNLGFGVNKGGFYELNKIQQIKMTDEVRNALGDLAPEYSGKNLYHVQLSMAVTDNYKDSRLGDLKQNFFFKNKKELEGFLSSNFDVVAERDKDGIKIKKEHLDKFDIRELQDVKGQARYVDKLNNWQKNQQELYDHALDFQANKILTSRAENTFLRDSSYNKIDKALNLEEELLDFFKKAKINKSSLSQREINQIMSGRIASGDMALRLNNKQVAAAQNMIKEALSHVKTVGDTEVDRLLDSTIDNYSSIMSFISKNKTVLNNIRNEIETRLEGYSDHYKQEIFARTYEAAKREVAEHIYRNSDNTNPAKAIGVYTNKRLQTNLHEFKNMYEIDFSSLAKNNNISFYSLHKPEELTNLHRFDISTKSPMYSLIDKATQAVFGKDYRGNITDSHKQLAVEELFTMLNKEDSLLKETKAFKNFKDTFGYKNNKLQQEVNYLNIADTIVAGMQEVKANDKFAGIKNLRYSFMKSLEGNDSFIAALNSEVFQKEIGSITESVINNTNVNFISSKYGTKNIDHEIGTIVDKSLLHHYIPDADKVKAAIGNDSRKEMLYNKGVKDIREYLIDTIKGFSYIDGTEISIQHDGALLINNGGNDPIILNKLPQLKLNEDSGVLYVQAGGKKIQFNKKFLLSSEGTSIKGDVGTSLSQLNEYSNSKAIQNIVKSKGEVEGLRAMFSKISYDMRNLGEGPTINNFGGNDIDSNYNVDLSDIKNVLNDLFGENGKFKYYLSEDYMDKDLKDVLQEKLKRASYDERGRLKDLSPDITRDLVKDMFHILDDISKNGNVSQDFLDVLNNTLGFTGQEKKVSNYLMAYEGTERPHNSTFGVFDNSQRPPITQSGNAKFLRVNDLEKIAKDKNVIAGNLINTEYIENKTMRKFSGIGRTTTDVMLDTYYASTNALKVLIESNFNDVISKSKVEFGSEKAARNVYTYIRDSINTFEQERIMDSRIFEDIYGLQSAATHKLSKGTDIKSILKDLEGEELEKQKRLISNHIGDIKLKNGEILYESSVGAHVTRGEGTLKSKGFANLKTSFSSKVKDGVFNFNYYNSSGMKLKDKEINQIIKENKTKFMENGEFVESFKFRNILNDILEEKGIIGQFAIEDMNALGYAKTMTSGAEKGMTDILYATTGKYDKNVRKVFENIGMWDSVKTKVLTDEAIDALVLKDKDNINHLKTALKGTKFSTIDDLKAAMKQERHMHSKMLFEYGLGNKVHLLANDNVVGHANFGAMYQGSLSKAIDLLSKKHENGLEGAVQTIVDMINGDGEFKGTNDFKFMENWDLSKNKVDISHIGVKNVNGRLVINENFLTENNRISNLNSQKFNNLLKAIDAKYLNDGTDSDDRLVRKNVYMVETKEDGTQEYKAVEELVGAFYSRQVDGKTVILGAQSKENTKIVTDVETQTGVTDEYFTLKKSLTNLKKEKIELESAMNSTNDSAVKSSLNKELLKVKNEINQAQDLLSDYDGSVKTMKFSDQELSIINRVAITQSHIDQINELIDKGELELDSINTLSLKGRLIVGADGKVKGTTDFNMGNMLKRTEEGKIEAYEGQGYRALDWFTDKLKKQQWFDEINDVKLDAKYLELDDYKHLKEVYDYFDNKGLSVGIKKAEEVFQTRMAVEARQFNAGSKNNDNIDALLNKGFEKMHIGDMTLDVEHLSTKNLLIDLGDDFSHDYRYIAVPGTGKTVVDEEIRKKSHGKLVALKHKYDEFLGVKGSGKDEELHFMNSIKSLADDIMKNVDGELFNKNGIMHNMSKVELTTPSYRNKLSGIIASHFDDTLAKTADGFDVSFINSLNSSLTNTATIDGKSIAELERSGKHYDYKFVSREQFENMGYFEKDKLKQFGFVDDEAGTAVSKMEDHLRKYGTIDIFDRYPNTRTGSIVPTVTFLDDSLTQNQSKISVSTAMKANADYDGDSGSNFLLRYTDDKGRQIDGAYFKRVENIAIENLNKEGKEITANSIVDAAEATGMISREDFENFSKLQGQMSTAAMTDNQKWAQKGKGILTKDNIKNIKIGDISNASYIEDGYSDFLSKNVFSRLSQMPSLDDFYATEQSASEILNKAREINQKNDIVKDLLKSGSDKEKEAWKKFNNIEDIRLVNSAEAMDKALAILENANSKGLVDTEYLEAAKSTAVKRIGQDKYVQEMMAKTGLAATGNVNLSLNSIKLATQFTEKDPSQIMFTNFIWEGLDVAEQGIISDKKRTNPGYDDKRIEKFTESIREIYDKGNKKHGRKLLSEWMDENGGDVFEVAYEEMGKYILGSKNFNSMSKEEGIAAMKNKFLDHVETKADDQRFLSIRATVDLIGRNGSHEKNLHNAIPAAINEDTFRSNAMEAVGLSSESRSAALKKLIQDEDRLRMQHAANQEAYEEGIAKSMKDITKASSSEAASNIMKHSPKIPLGGGSGIGTAMLGMAAGLLVAGYASGNPLKDKSAQQVAEGQTQPQQTMSVPQFMEQGGMVTGNSQQGYVINLQADTKKGRKYMQRMMAQAAQASVGGAVSVNMNLRDMSQNGVTDKDIENYMNRYL